jgi:hypothetical protein
MAGRGASRDASILARIEVPALPVNEGQDTICPGEIRREGYPAKEALEGGDRFWQPRGVRWKTLVCLVVVGCGGPATTGGGPPNTGKSGASEPTAGVASAGASASPAPTVEAPDAAPQGSGEAGKSGAPVGSAASGAPEKPKETVLLDTKLPPKVVSAGGSYRIGLEDVKGSTRGEVMASVEKGSKAVDGCFAEIFKAGGKKGKIAFAVVVDGKKKLKSAKLQGDDLQDKKLPKCLEGALKKIEWPASTEKEMTFVLAWDVQS